MRATLVIILVLAVALSLLSGCGRKTAKIGGVEVTQGASPSGETTVKVAGKGTTVTATGSEEGRSITEAELGVPVYPGAVVKNEMTMTTDKGEGTHFALSTPDEFSKVESFYKANIKATNSFSGKSGAVQTAMFSIENGDTVIQITVSASKDEPGTRIMVFKGKK